MFFISNWKSHFKIKFEMYQIHIIDPVWCALTVLSIDFYYK